MLTYAAAGVHEAAVVRRGGLRRHSLRATPPAGTGGFLLYYCYFATDSLLLRRHSLRAAPPAGTGGFLLYYCYFTSDSLLIYCCMTLTAAGGRQERALQVPLRGGMRAYGIVRACVVRARSLLLAAQGAAPRQGRARQVRAVQLDALACCRLLPSSDGC
jgi:hypothetical protein